MPGWPLDPSLQAGSHETRLPAHPHTGLAPVDPDAGPTPVIPSTWSATVDPVSISIHVGMRSPKETNKATVTVTDPEEMEIYEVSDKEFRKFLRKFLNFLKEIKEKTLKEIQ